ncbi:MAG: hypothetical protein PF693_00055 [Spirochaetia bacterium]|jgi:hypothetical protein|nr:hypothetical protein [Spirochaetia bacterium]
MKIKYLIIIILVNIILVSCTKVEILTDNYWPFFVSDFQGSAFSLKFQAFTKGFKLKLTTSELENEISLFTESEPFESDIYLLSPLLSQKISDFSNINNKSIFYYFEKTTNLNSNSTDNFVMIKQDRLESFYEAGKMLNNRIKGDSVLPVIYDIENRVLEGETQSFMDGFDSGELKIDIIAFEITNANQELDIRKIFENDAVQNSDYLVIFSNNWKNLCLELAEKENKMIVTSDSLFYNSYESSILFSIEDNLKGMLNKVYNSAKMKNLDDITLEGVILK